MSAQGIVFNIQRFTIHDGPGVRTELFLKGCPLRCRWCSNPESWQKSIELGIYKSKCITAKKCGSCQDVCPHPDALQFYRGKLNQLNRSICSNCMVCYNECPSDAIKLWGERLSVEECMQLIRRDIGYYNRSGGGVTVSGGEPLLQSDFVADLFRACKAENIHTCCETTFCTQWGEVEKILPFTDLFISDLKHMNSTAHQQYTNVPNDLILQNLKKLASLNRPLILRIPVIPGVNDDDANIAATADFIQHELNGNVQTLQLLSYMRLGEEKYTSLGIPYPMADMRINRRSFQKHVEEIATYMNLRGIHCQVGTHEKT